MPSGYTQWHHEAQKRTKRGLKQKQCLCHGLWWFHDERKGHKFKKASRVRMAVKAVTASRRGEGMTQKQIKELLKSEKFPSLTEKQSREIWKRINEKMFSQALLEFKNEIVSVRHKIQVSRKSHELGMKGSDSLSLPWHWHQGYRDADNWIGSLIDKAFSELGKKIMGIDPVGLPLEKSTRAASASGERSEQ